MKQIDVAIAIIHRAGQVLICQRHANNSFANLWEFPGGKVEPGESPEQCLDRELHEELGVVATRVDSLPHIEHEYATVSVRLRPYICTLASGDPHPLASQRLQWVDASQLRDHPFPAANRGLIEQVIERLTNY